MSERPPAHARPPRCSPPAAVPTGLAGGACVVALALPLYLEEFWLQTGLFAMFGAIVGAIGLNLLVGTTGQLSLAHAFFVAVGASRLRLRRRRVRRPRPGRPRGLGCRRWSA